MEPFSLDGIAGFCLALAIMLTYPMARDLGRERQEISLRRYLAVAGPLIAVALGLGLTRDSSVWLRLAGVALATAVATSLLMRATPFVTRRLARPARFVLRLLARPARFVERRLIAFDRSFSPVSTRPEVGESNPRRLPPPL